MALTNQSLSHIFLATRENEVKGKGDRKTSQKEFDGKKKRKEGERRKQNGGFPAFRRSKLDGLSTKVGPCIAIYMWISKTWSFIKLHEVGNFPTRSIFSLKVI